MTTAGRVGVVKGCCNGCGGGDDSAAVIGGCPGETVFRPGGEFVTASCAVNVKGVKR